VSAATSDARIGWIGIGRMGYAMAERLAKGGAGLTVWNRTRSKAEPLAQHGAKIATALPELAACGIVFCMVSTWDDVKEVVAGDTVSEVLAYVDYSPSDLLGRLRNSVEQALRKKLMTIEESRTLINRFRQGMIGYTYLDRE